jgi:hypothetical protein
MDAATLSNDSVVTPGHPNPRRPARGGSRSANLATQGYWNGTATVRCSRRLRCTASENSM